MCTTRGCGTVDSMSISMFVPASLSCPKTHGDEVADQDGACTLSTTLNRTGYSKHLFLLLDQASSFQNFIIKYKVYSISLLFLLLLLLLLLQYILNIMWHTDFKRED